MGVTRFAGCAAGLMLSILSCAGSAFAQTTDKPNCTVPNSPPKVVKAAPVDTPAEARSQGISGQVDVWVALDAASHIVGRPYIYRSPSIVLNKSAIDAAAASVYQTEISNCVPVETKFLFTVRYQAQ
jgi:Gram-negative bacterial TonB protein C-terminal